MNLSSGRASHGVATLALHTDLFFANDKTWSTASIPVSAPIIPVWSQ
jgi:hypothetical protein